MAQADTQAFCDGDVVKERSTGQRFLVESSEGGCITVSCSSSATRKTFSNPDDLLLVFRKRRTEQVFL